MATDVRDSDDVRALVERVAHERGRLDMLFNNAGIEIHGSLAETDDALHRNQIDVNVHGVFYGIKWGVRAMLQPRAGVRRDRQHG